MLTIDAVILIVTVIIATVVHTKFGTILIWTGFAAIVVGALAATGAEDVVEYDLRLDQKIPQLNYERSPGKWQEMNRSYYFCLLTGAAGGLSVVVGLAINYLFTGAF
jgi:hypothetical protein